MEVRWTEQALADLESIQDYIAKDDAKTAASFIMALADSAQKLGQFPFLGHKIPELDNEDIRELLFGEYRIIYKVAEDTIWIAAVIHGRRLLRILQ